MLHEEYLKKARTIDREYVGVQPGVVGPVETKLLSFERVQGLVFGAWGEGSEPVHQLIDKLADSRVSVAGPQKSKKGLERSPEGERAVVVGMLRRKLSIAAVRAQCSSLHGRLATMGPGLAASVARRGRAVELERELQRDRLAHLESLRQHHSVVRKGFGKTD